MELSKLELVFLGQQVHRAALQRHRGGDALMFEHVLRVNARTPLNQYFMRVALFVQSAKLCAPMAWAFRDKVADADATDILLTDALPLIFSDPGAYNVTDQQLIYLRTIAAAVRWFNDTAYETAQSWRREPINDL
jgi:hypothetical protein